jgi:outer membrane protein
MRKFSLIAVTLIFAAFLAVSANAQTTAAGKIGLVAWGAFEDPTKGIKKYAAALAVLDKEFETINNELRTMLTKYQTLKTELENLTKQMQEKKIPINELTLQTKANELGQLERDIKKKQEDAKANYQARFNILIGPIQEDIFKALNEFAAAKGYAVIFDGAKLQEAGVLLGWPPTANVTEEFIVFYNARPATATK